MRTAEKAGVAVRYVYPESPAAKAGVEPGDVIFAVDGKPAGGRIELWSNIAARAHGEKIELEVRRGEAARKVGITLAALPDALPPADLPLSHAKTQPDAGNQPQVGALQLKLPEFSNEVWVYVPKDYDATIPYGVVVSLHAPSGYDWPEILARWKDVCDRHDLILVAPKATDPAKWVPGEAALVDRLLADVSGRYNVDPARVVVAGHEAGGMLAYLTAFRNREVIRAVAAVEAAPPGQAPENDPTHRLAVYSAAAAKSRFAHPIEAGVAAMRQFKIPVTVKKLGDAPRPLNPDEVAELARWIDMLDRI